MAMHDISANGANIPVLGFGTWPMKGATARNAVGAALDLGYRHIDTAAMYGNEREVGEAIRANSTPREEIFITTKVWPTDVAAGRLVASAESSVKLLKVEQVNLLLIHWPSPGVKVSEQVRQLCDAHKRGLCRHIGISNFSAEQVEEAVRSSDHPLVTNQIEHYPGLDQRATFDACARHGIAITSYSPLGKGAVLREAAITNIAREKGKTPAQIVLRWHIQQPQNIVIPKSADPKRIAENMDIFGFTLSDREMEEISALGRRRH
jgi:diketogulonate reductase-like aldo/keto reductase